MTAPVFIDEGEGPAILFLHGIGGNADNWAAQIAALKDRRRCIAWNMPGYGGNPGKEVLDFAGMAADLAALLDGLALRQVTLCGLSMGAYLAQEFTARYPQRTRALILMSAGAAFGKPDGEFRKRFLAERLAPLDRGETPAGMASELIAGMMGPDADPAAASALEASMARVSPATYRAALHCLVGFDRRDSARRIGCPALLIAGECDKLAPWRMMSRLAEHIPDAGFNVITGAGHVVNMEQPEAVNRLLVNFIGELEAKACGPILH